MEPGGQLSPVPGAAVQGTQAAASLVAPVTVPYLPATQAVQAVAEDSPVAAPHRPAGQAVFIVG
jgi:hypothetical protein